MTNAQINSQVLDSKYDIKMHSQKFKFKKIFEHPIWYFFELVIL